MGSWVPVNTNTAGVVPVYNKAKATFTLNTAANTVLVTATTEGDIGDFTVTMVNDVGAGAETHIWTATTLVIHKAATSTLAQVVAAAGGVTGAAILRWGVLTAVGVSSTALADLAAAVPVRRMPNATGGYLSNQYK